MKRKIISLGVWILISVLYCMNIADLGRSMGWKVNYAIERQADFRHSEDIGEQAANAFLYPKNLDKEFQFCFATISITTVVYWVISMFCYRYWNYYKNDY